MLLVILFVIVFAVVYFLWESYREKRSINMHKKNQKYQAKESDEFRL